MSVACTWPWGDLSCAPVPSNSNSDPGAGVYLALLDYDLWQSPPLLGTRAVGVIKVEILTLEIVFLPLPCGAGGRWCPCTDTAVCPGLTR